MNKIAFDVIAFDLDGTLADTAPDLTAALNHVLAHFGRKAIPADMVRNLIGHGARALIRRGLAATGDNPESLVDEGLPIFLDFYANHICEETQPYEGLERALDSLTAQDVALAICTNKPEALALQLIEALGWNGRFRAIVGGDTLALRKPDPAPLLEAITRAGGGKAAFIGDSIVDADTARAAGLPLIAVSFGFSDRPVKDLRADIVIDHYDELLPGLARLRG